MTKTIASFSGEWEFLSNFHPSEITHEGIVFPTVEHAYQAAKTMDWDLKETFASIPTPGRAKRFGRKVPIRSDWESAKIPVMRKLLRAKFEHEDLRELLLATGDAELIEGNNWGDKFWGKCYGEGENWLGKLLMHRRTMIENEGEEE